MPTLPPSPAPNPPLLTRGTAAFRAAVAAACVSGALVVLLAAALVVNYTHDRNQGLIDGTELAGMKAALKANPADAALADSIRATDFRLRQDFFRRKTLAERGRWLLLGSLGVLLVALQLVAAGRRQPLPPGTGRDEYQAAQQAAFSRWSVAALAAVLGGATVSLVLSYRPGLPPEEVARLRAAAPAVLAPVPEDDEVAREWPMFRGPGGLGVAVGGPYPTAWDAKTGAGILWKTEVPFAGHGSPVVWGERVFLTGATRDRRAIFAFDARHGRLDWQAAVLLPESSRAEPPSVMDDTGYAPSTPATDGRRVYAIFPNGDLAAVTVTGRPVWAVNLGQPANTYGHASSLLLWRDLLLVQYDQGTADEGKSYLLAYEAATGKKAWEVSRAVDSSWASPILCQVGGKPQVVTAANPAIIAYDPAGGLELWRVDGLHGEVAPSPAFGGGLVLVALSGANAFAIRPDGSGDVTETHVAWKGEEGLPDISSPLGDGERFYLLNGSYLTVYRARDGQKLYDHDLAVQVHASPVVADGKVYLLGTDGTMVIVAKADEYRELGRATLGEHCYATPAFIGGRIYARGMKHLYGIGPKP